MTQKIVGLCGLRGAGKDTAAAVLLDAGWQRTSFASALYEQSAAAFDKSVAFFENRATKEKNLPDLAFIKCLDEAFVLAVMTSLRTSKAVRKAYKNPTAKNISYVSRRTWKKVMHKARSPRNIMQWWGTEYRRTHSGKDYWLNLVMADIQAQPSKNFVITDVRFKNEGDFVKKLNGLIGRCWRPSQDKDNDPNLMHASEREMLTYPVDFTFVNEEGAVGRRNFQRQVAQALL